MTIKLTSKNIDNFFKKVNKTDSCWNWTASFKVGKYGAFGVNGIIHLAHRISYHIHFGPISFVEQVCHKCDNPSCVNPEHLFLGNHRINMQDCTEKGRHRNLSAERNKEKTHCKNGHEFTTENTRNVKTQDRKNTRRLCKICSRRYANKRYHERKLK